MNESEDLKKLVSKLNDRNLNRQRESGLTFYAILAAFLILFVKILENSNIYVKDNFSAQSILITIITLDICFLISLVFLSLTIFIERPINVKIIPSSINKLTIYLKSPIIFIQIILAIINFYVSFRYIKFISTIPFGIIGGFCLWPEVIILWYKLKYRFRIRNQKFKIPTLSSLNIGYRGLISNYLIIFYISIFTYIVIYSIYFCQLLKTKYYITYILNGCSIFILFILIIIFIRNYISRYKYNWLENFEIEIYLNKINEADIKNRLEKDYFEINLVKWILNQFDEMYKQTELILKIFENCMDDYKRIMNQEHLNRLELIGFFEDIRKKTDDADQKYSLFISELDYQLKMILIEYSLNSIEYKELVRLKENSMSYISKVNSLSNKAETVFIEFSNLIKNSNNKDFSIVWSSFVKSNSENKHNTK